MASKAAYKGVRLERATYTNPDMPGWWFPRLQMVNPCNGADEWVSLAPQKGSKQDADLAAIREAMRRIDTGDHGLGPLPPPPG